MGLPARMIWAPQAGPQKSLVDCPYKLILFGGARGGGKTDGILGKWAIKGERYGKAFNAVFFRREMPQQDDLIERAKEIYIPIGARWFEQRKMFVLPSGGRIRFRPLENTTDAEKYQGQNLTDAAVEEAGNYADPAPIDRLFGCLRSGKGVPIQLILTANPGGKGHHWLRARFVDPAPRGMKPIVRVLPNGKEFRSIFIPSKVSDNRILLAGDPEYITRLYLTGSPALVKAWLEGDWNVIAGAFFPEMSARHIVEPQALPAHYLRFCSYDHGSSRPFSVGWYAVSDGTDGKGGTVPWPAGSLIKYREWYGMAENEPNVGLHLDNRAIAAGVLEREGADEKIAYRVADPSIFKEEGGPSVGEQMHEAGLTWTDRADNARIPGAGQFRSRLWGEGFGTPAWTPAIYFFSTCVHTIRTIPALQHDEREPEVPDTRGEDHAYDETRYACMSRPWTVELQKQFAPRDITKMTMDELWAATEAEGERRERL